MFNNCRQYNEEGSMIYEDANKLEEVLTEKMREMGLSTILLTTPTVAVTPLSAAAMPTAATATSTLSESTSARRTVERRV
jgi:protein polybromo-1